MPSGIHARRRSHTAVASSTQKIPVLSTIVTEPGWGIQSNGARAVGHGPPRELGNQAKTAASCRTGSASLHPGQLSSATPCPRSPRPGDVAHR